MFNAFSEFWESLGWVANLTAIVGASVTIWALMKRRPKQLRDWVDRRRFNRVSSFVEAKLPDRNWVNLELRRRARIAVVDDNPDDFPLDHLRQAEFKVDVFEQLPLADSGRLHNYDVILLDIGGVVPEDPLRGGLLLISRLKDKSGSPSIIAVSGMSFDPTVTEFFRKADDVMKKPISANECEMHLQKIMEQRLSPFNTALRVDSLAIKSRAFATDQSTVARQLISYLQGRYTQSQLRAKLEARLSQKDASQTIESLDLIRTWLSK